MAKTTAMQFDRSEVPDVEAMTSLLEPFGLHVYDYRGLEGSDCYGYIISDAELTEAELQRISEEEDA